MCLFIHVVIISTQTRNPKWKEKYRWLCLKPPSQLSKPNFIYCDCGISHHLDKKMSHDEIINYY